MKIKKLLNLLHGRFFCIGWILIFWIIIPAIYFVDKHKSFLDACKNFWNEISETWKKGL